MNKKAQKGPIALVFLVILFIIVWYVALGKFVSDMGQLAIQESGENGFVAFCFANMNIFILVFLILFVIGYFYWAGNK